MMNSTDYMEKLKARYTIHYDLEETPEELDPYDVDLRATFQVTGSKHMISKKIVLFTIREAEYCFVRKFDRRISAADVLSLTDLLEGSLDELVEPSPEHKKTTLTGVIIAGDGIDSDAEELIRRYKKTKNYKYLMHGWSEIHIVAADINNEKIIHNVRAYNDRKYLNRLYDFF